MSGARRRPPEGRDGDGPRDGSRVVAGVSGHGTLSPAVSRPSDGPIPATGTRKATRDSTCRTSRTGVTGTRDPAFVPGGTGKGPSLFFVCRVAPVSRRDSRREGEASS